MSLFTQKTGKMTYLCRDKIPITCQTWASGRKLRHWALLLYSNVHARGGRASLCSRSSPGSHSQVKKIRKISSEDEFLSPAEEGGIRAELGTPGLTPSAELGVSHPNSLSRNVLNSHEPKVLHSHKRGAGWLFRAMKSERQAWGFRRAVRQRALRTQTSPFLSATGPRLLTEQLLNIIIFSLGKHSSTIRNCF